ncbi:glycogen synthase [Enterobacter soli]|uniref:glycogen synthase n=1 Tax=Enterobacter soli TaxID=885040 RepID=UPI0034CD3DDF
MDITIQSLDFIAQSFAIMDASTNARSVEALTGNMPLEVRDEFNRRYNQYRDEIMQVSHPAVSAASTCVERG